MIKCKINIILEVYYMKKENVKVIIWGFGAMGAGMAETLLKKKGVEIVGAIDIEPKLGNSIYDYIDMERGDNKDIIIKSSEEVIKEGEADIVIVATDSFTRKAFDKIKYCLERKINVITTAEEMAYPQAQEPKLAKELDRIGKENKVTVLGTGINPGLIMDLLVIALTGACTDIDYIKAKRVNDLYPFR